MKGNFVTKDTSTGMRGSFSPKTTLAMMSLGSRHRTRKNPFRVTLKSRSFTFGISFMSIPENMCHFIKVKECVVCYNLYLFAIIPTLTSVRVLLGRLFLL